MNAIGRKIWAFSGGHVPLLSTGEEPRDTSRDELCVLNTNSTQAHVEVTVYYEDQAPVGPYALTISAQRVRHVRFNDLIDPHALPLDTPYAAVISADVPIVVQFTRREASLTANAIATTLAFPVD
jgi:hypothetical protein